MCHCSGPRGHRDNKTTSLCLPLSHSLSSPEWGTWEATGNTKMGQLTLPEGIGQGFLEELVSGTDTGWKDEGSWSGIPEKEARLAWGAGPCVGWTLMLGQE